MTDAPLEYAARLDLVRRALALSPEPLHAPLGIEFLPASGEAHLRAWSEHAARVAAGSAFAPATLYANVPFCARVCTYCLLSAVRVPGKDVVAAYVEAMRRQIALYAPLVGGLRFGSVHVGGGTPTLLDERQLEALLGDLLKLPRTENAQIGVEAHPATSTPGRLAVLRNLGVHRLSFGVESLTPAVLRNVNREDQTEARVRAALAEARRLGFSINVDLLAGLPGETLESWLASVKTTLELEPDSLSVNRFLGENSPLARFGYGPDEATSRSTDEMLLRADVLIRELAPPRWPAEPLARAAFGTQYVWDRSDRARRYFQDDMIGPVSTLAIGHGALGHVYGRHFSVAAGSLAEYVASLARGAAPAMLESAIDERFEMAFFVADQACRGELSGPTFRRIFGTDLGATFGRELTFLLRAGLLARRGDRVAKPPHRDFQVAHLLAFLLRDAAALAPMVRELDAAARARRATDDERATIASGDDIDALADRWAQGEARTVRVDVGDGVDGETAARLASAARTKGLAIEVRSDDRRPLREYDHAREEMPPSMLWVRLAVRASQASRGEQRLAVLRRNDARDAGPGGG